MNETEILIIADKLNMPIEHVREVIRVYENQSNKQETNK